MPTAERRPFNVLFLCTGNSARSILAEAIMNRVGAGRFRGYSAGSMPTGRVNPHALALLKKLDHPTEGLRSKAWDKFAKANNPEAPQLDFVFTVCDNAAGEVCPIWPGQPMTAHWGLPDPAAVDGSEAEIALAFSDTYRLLSNRITIFTNLPVSSLDRLSLQRRLDEIGRSADQPAAAD
jgi:protein-tyrosine-phosphatase